jgi:hypothetical protein
MFLQGIAWYYFSYMKGCSISIFAAVEFGEKNPHQQDRVSVFSYGSPRYVLLSSNNRKFRMVEVSRHICVRKADLPVVKLGDIVLHLPWLQLGYIHSGRQYVRAPKGESRECIYTNLAESDECNLPITQQSIEHHFFYYGWKADERYCRS